MIERRLFMDTIYVSLKSAGTETKSVDYDSPKDVASYLLDKLTESSSDMSDEDKQKMSAKIYRKLQAGKKLSPKEEQYLRETNPQMYQQYLRIRSMANAMKEQLKHATSKEQANDIITSSVSSVSDKDPYKEFVIAAMEETAKEFKSSIAYSKLPNKESDVEKGKKAKTAENRWDEEAEEDDFDPENWSPLQEVLDTLPTVNFSA
jgi:hypothetical protein